MILRSKKKQLTLLDNRLVYIDDILRPDILATIFLERSEPVADMHERLDDRELLVWYRR